MGCLADICVAFHVCDLKHALSGVPLVQLSTETLKDELKDWRLEDEGGQQEDCNASFLN